MLPHFTGAVVCGGYVGQLVVQGNVSEHGDEDGAHQVKQRPPKKKDAEGRPQPAKASPPATRDSTAVPKNAPRNEGLITTTLIDCIAPIPSAAGTSARAFIMKLENAKKIPPTKAEPSRAIVPTIGMSWSIA
jgi:hypothetical protein